MEKRIILASSSPRRQELLQNLGLEFQIHPSGVDETVVDGLKPSEVVELLAERKATDVARLYSHELVIGSDTIVVVDGQILGKPEDQQQAFQMISSLQGRSHHVYSGLAIIDAATGAIKKGHIKTQVHMRAISDAEIEDYVMTGEPMDKAGAYAIQGLGSIFITGIEGDYFSVVGLPVQLLADFLEGFGILILKHYHIRHTTENRK